MFAVAISSNFLFYFKGLWGFEFAFSGGFCGVEWVLFFLSGCFGKGLFALVERVAGFGSMFCQWCCFFEVWSAVMWKRDLSKLSLQWTWSESFEKFRLFFLAELQAQFIKFQTVCCQYQPIILRIRLVRLRNPYRVRIRSWSNLFCWLPTFYGRSVSVRSDIKCELAQTASMFQCLLSHYKFSPTQRVSEFHTEHATTAGDDDDAAAVDSVAGS